MNARGTMRARMRAAFAWVVSAGHCSVALSPRGEPTTPLPHCDPMPWPARSSGHHLRVPGASGAVAQAISASKTGPRARLRLCAWVPRSATRRLPTPHGRSRPRLLPIFRSSDIPMSRAGDRHIGGSTSRARRDRPSAPLPQPKAHLSRCRQRFSDRDRNIAPCSHLPASPEPFTAKADSKAEFRQPDAPRSR